MKKRVLVVATSRRTRGGITAVVRAHTQGEHWTRFGCRWVQSHRDGNPLRKVLYFATGLSEFLLLLPFCDIVHIHTSNYRTEIRKRIFARLAHLAGKRLVVHLHSSEPELSVGGRHRDVYRYSFTHADRIVVLSQSWRREVIRAFPEVASRVVVLENPCVPPLLEHLPFPEHGGVILFAGTLTPRKGYDDLLHAFAKIAPRHPGWTLRFAGNGEMDRARSLAHRLDIEERVEFSGWIEEPLKSQAFASASIYCLPSYSEGFPMGVLDAWAYGTPVVATPVGGLGEIAHDGHNMLSVPPGDIDALASALERAMDPATARRLSHGGRALATGRFALPDISRRLADLYSELI